MDIVVNHWRNPSWQYHGADTHIDPALFRQRMQMYRLKVNPPKLVPLESEWIPCRILPPPQKITTADLVNQVVAMARAKL